MFLTAQEIRLRFFLEALDPPQELKDPRSPGLIFGMPQNAKSHETQNIPKQYKTILGYPKIHGLNGWFIMEHSIFKWMI